MPAGPSQLTTIITLTTRDKFATLLPGQTGSASGEKQAHSQVSQYGTNELLEQHIGTGYFDVPMTLQVHVFEWF